jgi:hypothetical protein
MRQDDNPRTRREPCAKCGSPVVELVRTFTTDDGQFLGESVIKTKCTNDDGCFGAV